MCAHIRQTVCEQPDTWISEKPGILFRGIPWYFYNVLWFSFDGVLIILVLVYECLYFRLDLFFVYA